MVEYNHANQLPCAAGAAAVTLLEVLSLELLEELELLALELFEPAEIFTKSSGCCCSAAVGLSFFKPALTALRRNKRMVFRARSSSLGDANLSAERSIGCCCSSSSLTMVAVVAAKELVTASASAGITVVDEDALEALEVGLADVESLSLGAAASVFRAVANVVFDFDFFCLRVLYMARIGAM